MSGFSTLGSIWHVELPLIRTSILNAFLIGFVFSMGELAASQLVAPPGYQTLPIRMFTILHYGQDHLVAAMVILIMVFAVLLFTLYGLATQRRNDWL